MSYVCACIWPDRYDRVMWSVDSVRRSGGTLVVVVVVVVVVEWGGFGVMPSEELRYWQ